ncbi:MAG TPA: hypothetical protein VGK53_02160 [Propionicimonas sp.]
MRRAADRESLTGIGQLVERERYEFIDHQPNASIELSALTGSSRTAWCEGIVSLRPHLVERLGLGATGAIRRPTPWTRRV